MAKGHPKVGWAPIGFAMAAPCTNLPEGIVLGIVLGWAPIGFAAMATLPTLSILLWSYLIFGPILQYRNMLHVNYQLHLGWKMDIYICVNMNI